MTARVPSYLLQGVDAIPCEIEVDVDDRGLDRETIVGLPDAAVKEALERVRSALSNAGYPHPQGRLLINLAPADVRKEGPVYDLPIAVGMLLAQNVIREQRDEAAGGLDHRRYVFAGELALDGRVRPVRGVIALASMARAMGAAGVIVPSANASEAAVVDGIDAIGVSDLSEVVGLLNGTLEPAPMPCPDVSSMLESAGCVVDFADVRGQEPVKRAIVIAAAGGHNLLALCPSDSNRG